jgi:hypothetical protein
MFTVRRGIAGARPAGGSGRACCLSSGLVRARARSLRQPLAARALAAHDQLSAMTGDIADECRDPGLREAHARSAAATAQDGVAAARAAGLDAVGDAVESDGGEWRAIATRARTHRASVIVTGTCTRASPVRSRTSAPPRDRARPAAHLLHARRGDRRLLGAVQLPALVKRGSVFASCCVRLYA